MEDILTFKDVCYAYDDEPALKFITFSVGKGETIVLQGPNGCGKSTLLKLLNGIIFSDGGEIRFKGDLLDEKSMKNNKFSKAFHQQVGFIFQNADVQLFCGNVEEEIAFGPNQMGLADSDVKKRTDDMIELLGIEKLRMRAPYHLSGGEKRKVAIACVLSMNPDVLVFDEPLTGLDNKSQEWLIGFLKQLKSAGKTIIISTHNDHLADELADRRIIMNDDHKIEKIV